MKRLAIVNEKGGVGKTLVATQMAFFAALQKGKRVLVLDFDQQCNTTHCLSEHSSCTTSKVTTFDVLTKGAVPEERGNLVLVSATSDLMGLERRCDEHPQMIKNLKAVLEKLDGEFDIAIFDTNPSPDIRAVLALILASHAVTPVQLNREALDGVVLLYNKMQKAKQINPELTFLGLLPNLVERKPFQQKNLEELLEKASNILLKDKKGKVLKIASATALAEAQAESRPVWEGEKSTAARTWKQVVPVFETILKKMGC